jgi:hypothetical protein
VSVANAQTFLDQAIPERLPVRAGQVTHTRTEIYQRYGPKATEIRAIPGTGPENMVQEGWYEFGANQSLTRWRVTLVDASGSVIQHSVLNQGRLRVTAGGTGAVLFERPTPGSLPADAPAERAQQIRAALNAGRARPVTQTADLLTVEFRENWRDLFPSGRTSGPSGVAIPYAEDLSPVELVTRVSIRSDGVLMSEEQYARTPGGREVLIESRRTTLHEIRDAAPSGTFEG